MSLKIDRVQLDIVINNDQARVQLRKLEEEARTLTKEMSHMVKGTEEYVDKSKELDRVKAQMDNVYNSIGIANLNLKELTARSRELTLLRKYVRPGTEEFIKIDNELKQVNARMGELKGKAIETGGSVQTGMSSIVRAVTSVYFAVLMAATAVIAFGRSMVTAYEESAIANQKLKAAVNGDKVMFRDLAGEARKMQDNLGIPDETTKGLMVMGLETGKSAEMVKKMVQAATELSALTGDDLDNAFKKINATFNGTAGRLTRVDADFGNLTKTQLENGGAVDLILQKYSGLAEQSVKPTELLSAAWHELKETIGGVLSFLGPVMKFVSNYINSFTKEIASATEQFQDQVKAVNNLTTNINPLLDRYDQLKSKAVLSNNEQKEMLDIVGKVQSAFPGAVTAFDNYGNAIAISTNRTRDFINMQAAAMKALNKKAIDETKQSIKDVIAEQAKMIPIMDQITKTGTYKVSENKTFQEENTNRKLGDFSNTKEVTKTVIRDATQDEIKAQEEAYRKLLAQKKEYYDAVEGLSGDYMKAEAARAATASKGGDVTDEAYQNLTDKITVQEGEMRNLLASGQKIPADMQKAYDELVAQKKKIDKALDKSPDKAGTKAGEDAYKQDEKVLQQWIENKNNLLQAGYEKELAELHEKYRQEREAVSHDLAKNDKLTAEQKETLNGTLKDIDAKYVLDVDQLKKEQQIKELQDQKQLTDTRLAAARTESAEELQLKIEAIDTQEKIEVAALTGSEEYKAKMKKAINDKYEKQRAAEQEKFGLNVIDEQTRDEIIALTDGESKKLEELKKKRDAGEISQKEFNKQSLAIQNKFKIDSLNISLDKAQKELDIIKASGGDVTQAEEAIAATRLQIQNEQTAQEVKTKPKWTEKDTFNAAVDSAKIIADAEFQISRDKNQRELDDKLSALSTQRDAELSNKNLTEKQKADINTKYDAKERAVKKAAWEKQHKADIAQAWINLALSVGKAAINIWPLPAIPMMAMAALEGGMQIAAITAQGTPQFAAGRYDVLGALDGKQYKNVPYAGEARTGIYTHPALVAEKGSELIVDSRTTRNIQMNYPEILNAIQLARVPQFAAGRFTDKLDANKFTDVSSTARQRAQDLKDDQMITAMNRFSDAVNTLQSEGVHLDYQRLKDMQKKEARAEGETAM